MEQSIELMRRRHAYFTQLIAEHQIHTAREFCEKLGEMFEIFGVEVGYSEDRGWLIIECEGYEYESYDIIDGVDGKLATISNLVEWKPMCSSEQTDIFSTDEWPPKAQN